MTRKQLIQAYAGKSRNTKQPKTIVINNLGSAQVGLGEPIKAVPKIN